MLSININLLFNAINILVLCVLVKLFLLKPVHKILEKRQALIESDISDANKAKQEALALEQHHRDSLTGVEDEKAAVVAAAQKKAAEESDFIITDAKRQANEIVQKAEVDAVNRKKEILRQTQSEISAIIVEATEKVSGVGGDSTLYDQFLKKAGESDGESGK